MKYFTLLLLIILLISCENKLSKVEKLLLDPSKKWVYYENYSTLDVKKTKFLTYMKFEKDGKYSNFYLRSNIQYGNKEYWQYLNESSELELITFNFVVHQVYEDSIILKNKKNNRIVKLLNHNVLE